MIQKRGRLTKKAVLTSFCSAAEASSLPAGRPVLVLALDLREMVLVLPSAAADAVSSELDSSDSSLSSLSELSSSESCFDGTGFCCSVSLDVELLLVAAALELLAQLVTASFEPRLESDVVNIGSNNRLISKTEGRRAASSLSSRSGSWVGVEEHTGETNTSVNLLTIKPCG